MDEDVNKPISESGGSAAVSPTAEGFPTITQPAAGPRCQPPTPAKCPCEERVDGKLCRKESDTLSTLGTLRCKEHSAAFEKKWNVTLNRLAMMLP